MWGGSFAGKHGPFFWLIYQTVSCMARLEARCKKSCQSVFLMSITLPSPAFDANDSLAIV